ncbi:MAG TPA: EthD domain-containing protein [Candidatus Pseudomonas excrementavium]|uniref:EthD domain-containing protein n=1 Tax=Halopseudomonas TaxID=2901189 RepID=UPI001C39A87A|nr:MULTISPECIES: EthD domain-containing protein [Halopseudomonas]WGK60876.1 EthD domain-containing protein [Halopseudomonas sp. SMJS2]HIZ52107.1 EthD domain-containing protein [Candidatus Pseudomonas excrementavium]
MKAVSLVSRRADLDRAGFRDYYETTHCWLAMRHFPFLGYTRNHLTDHPELDFDCISEFEAPAYLDDVDVMGSRSRQLVMDDELQFMDPERIRVAGVRRHILITPAQAVPAGRLDSRVLMLEQDQETLLALAQRLAEELAATRTDLYGMRLDLLDNDPRYPLPCNALLWLDWLDRSEPLPAALQQLPGLQMTLQVERCDTPQATLQERFVAFQP